MAIRLGRAALTFDPAVRMTIASQFPSFMKFSGMHRGSAQVTIATVGNFDPDLILSSNVAIGSCLETYSRLRLRRSDTEGNVDMMFVKCPLDCNFGAISMSVAGRFNI